MGAVASRQRLGRDAVAVLPAVLPDVLPALALLLGLSAQPAKETILFFVTNDCPISNSYAPEIARICAEYQPKGAGCKLVYVDSTMTDAAAREHASAYKHGAYPRLVDRHHDLVKAAGVTLTPEAALMSPEGKVLYRGRIDNSFVSLGQSRRTATEHDLRDALDATLAGKPAPHPRTKALGCYIPDLPASR